MQTLINTFFVYQHCKKNMRHLPIGLSICVTGLVLWWSCCKVRRRRRTRVLLPGHRLRPKFLWITPRVVRSHQLTGPVLEANTFAYSHHHTISFIFCLEPEWHYLHTELIPFWLWQISFFLHIVLDNYYSVCRKWF